MKGEWKEEARAGGQEGRPEIGAVIILISVHSTSILPTKKNLSVVGLVLFQNRKSNFHGKKQVL